MAQPNLHRICVGCRGAKPKNELLRIVKSKNNQIEIDLNQDKPGRGAYVCPTIECAELAAQKRGFNWSFRCDVPKSFYQELIQQVNKIEQ